MVVIKKVVLVFCIITSFILFSAGLHKVGVCISEGRILSDDEKIESAFSDIYRSVTSRESIAVHINTREDKSFPQYNPYSDAKDYMSHHPHCCEIVRRNYSTTYQSKDSSSVSGDDFKYVPSSFWEWVYGFNRYLVRAAYHTFYIDNNNNIRETVRAEFGAVNNCGAKAYLDFVLEDSDIGPFLNKKESVDTDPIVGKWSGKK
jgi:hypothetical protein